MLRRRSVRAVHCIAVVQADMYRGLDVACTQTRAFIMSSETCDSYEFGRTRYRRMLQLQQERISAPVSHIWVSGAHVGLDRSEGEQTRNVPSTRPPGTHPAAWTTLSASAIMIYELAGDASRVKRRQTFASVWESGRVLIVDVSIALGGALETRRTFQ